MIGYGGMLVFIGVSSIFHSLRDSFSPQVCLSDDTHIGHGVAIDKCMLIMYVDDVSR